MTTLAKFATNASTKVSDKYSFASTAQIHELLADYGFHESRYKQRATGGGFQRHISILNRAQDADEQGAFNLLLLNSHDGTSSVRLEAGYFRILCENQIGAGQVGIRVRHSGDVLSKIELAIPSVLNQMDNLRQLRELLLSQTLSYDQCVQLVERALELRGIPTTGQNMSRMATPRRYEGGSTAWETFNVIQENTVRGGVRLENNAGKLRKLRPINEASRLVQVNNDLTATVRELLAA